MAEEEIKDLSKKRGAAPRFRIGTRVYTGQVGLPADTVMDFTIRFGSMEAGTPVDQQIGAFKEILSELLEPESYRVLNEMTSSHDPADMIEFDQLEGAISYLLEAFGLRPTMPSDSSAPGPDSPGTGIAWTGSTSGEVSISGASASTGS
jgi:hypothetical protein